MPRARHVHHDLPNQGAAVVQRRRAVDRLLWQRPRFRRQSGAGRRVMQQGLARRRGRQVGR